MVLASVDVLAPARWVGLLSPAEARGHVPMVVAILRYHSTVAGLAMGLSRDNPDNPDLPDFADIGHGCRMAVLVVAFVVGAVAVLGWMYLARG